MTSPAASRPAQRAGRAYRGLIWRRRMLAVAGLLPFLIYCLLFEVLPALTLVKGSFFDAAGAFTFDNYHRALVAQYLHAYRTSIALSFLTALGGGVLGGLAAYAIARSANPRLRAVTMTFSGVAANFAGVPLAASFIATLGSAGFVTLIIKDVFHVNLYTDLGFAIYTFLGLAIVYIYFQIPLMVLLMIPALGGLKTQWQEAALGLGASNWQYWRYVAIPVLMPAILGALVLLFANSFGAYATAYSLAQASINIVTIAIAFLTTGDVLFDPGLADALAMGMILIMALSLLAYQVLNRRTQRWLR